MSISEIGSDIPPRAAEVEPPASCVNSAGGSAEPTMGVTGNALLFLGMIAGAMMEHGYVPTSVDGVGGSQVLQLSTTGNIFRVSVVQIEGTE